MLVLANESIALLSPDVIAHKVHRMLNKRTTDGAPQFPEINMIWMISEKHVTEFRPGVVGIPSLLLRQEIPDPMGVEEFVESLQPRWATFHHVPCQIVSGATLSDLRFRKNPNLEQPSQEGLTMAQVWHNEYNARPYLARMADRILIKHAGRIFAQMTPGFLKGFTDADHARSKRVMRAWAHFLDEVNRRGMDMRDIAPAIRPIKRRLRQRKNVQRLTRLGRNDVCPCASGKKFKHCHGKAT